jgi:tRNA nucleotidyltransferase (CCA-adding enzyme)
MMAPMKLQHISNNLIHPLAIEVCRILNNHQYQSYIVGGCVRDLLLGQIPKDWDITTDANPDQIIALFPKTIPTGLQHGTVTVCMDEGVANHFEVTTFRIEGEYKDGRRPEEVFFVKKIEEDLSRRDLTINAIAYDPIASHLVDPYLGVLDLKNELIKAVGSPTIRFQEDGLRIMRVARFAARFGYTVDMPTFFSMKDSLETLKKVSKERLKDEICKILMAPYASYGLHLLQVSGALEIACPLFKNRELPSLECQGELETRLAFLYSNLPIVNVEEELLNSKYSNKEIKKVSFLLQLIGQFSIFQAENSLGAYKNFIAFLKNQSPEPWEQCLEQFIELTRPLQIPVQELLAPYKDEVVLSRKELIINGNDLMEAGMVAGPRLKTVLNECYSEVLRHPEHNNKPYLLEYSLRC